MAKKPSKPKLTVTKGKTPSSEGDMGGSASKGKGASPLMMLGKKNYKKPGAEPPMDMSTGFGDTGMTGES